MGQREGTTGGIAANRGNRRGARCIVPLREERSTDRSVCATKSNMVGLLVEVEEGDEVEEDGAKGDEGGEDAEPGEDELAFVVAGRGRGNAED